MPESAREFKKTFKPTMPEMNAWWTSRSDEDDEWAKVYMLEFAEAYASSRVAALAQRIAELEANLVRYGDHEVIDGQFACASLGSKQPCNCGFEAALARLREVKG